MNIETKLTLCIFLLAGSAAADELSSGAYELASEGPGREIDRSDEGGGSVFLKDRCTDRLGKAKLISRANDNSLFDLKLDGAGPFPKGADKRHLAIVVAGRCFPFWSHSDPRPDGTMELGATVEGEEIAKQVAAELGIKPILRTHPGHRVVVTFKPEKKKYRVGEAVTLVMTIRNAGDQPVSFEDGGMQRGARNNQFGFTAFHNSGFGRALPDTGDPRHFGGPSGRPTLKPGEAFTKTIGLGDWFKFDEPDSYRILGTYRLAISDAELTAPVLWDDFATAECTVYVVK
jgi:hypothetical protein